jgi:hypothetical protein
MTDRHNQYQSETMMKNRKHSISLIISGLFVICAVPIVSAAQDNDAAAIVAIIDAIEKGWEQGDGTPFRKHYLDVGGTRYIEGGGQNEGLTDLVEHHVEPEGDALSNFELSLDNIEVHVEGNFAWAIADVEVEATVNSDGREIHNRGYETFLFRRLENVWKVVHTHSSSRPVKKD